MTAAADPRRARPITIRARGAANKRRAELFIDGQRWAVVEWGGPRRWCIEDDQSRCLEHVEDLRGEAATLKAAIALAEAMIRDCRMPSPEEAKRLTDEREQKQRAAHEAWDHPERLYEPLADALEMWAEREDISRSNSYKRLQDELVAIAIGAVEHFECIRDNALRALRQIELEASRRSHWYGDADATRAQLAYAEEHLVRARQILRTHAPGRVLLQPAAGKTAEQVIGEARAERMARKVREQREKERDPDGSKRARRLAVQAWHRNVSRVRDYAALMTDEELAWFARIEKSRGNGARKDPDDAVRLRDLDATLFQRWGDRHGAVLEAEDRSNAERLRRLGLASGEEDAAEARADDSVRRKQRDAQ